MRKIVLLLAALALAGCGEDEPALIDVKGSHGKADAAAIWGAIVAFQQACPDLSGKYWADVESATVEVWPIPEDARPYDYRWEQYGWPTYLGITVKIRNTPRKIPKLFKAGGHSLYYEFGGGARPGVGAKKEQSMLLCPMDAPADGSDGFKPWPAMAVIDDLR